MNMKSKLLIALALLSGSVSANAALVSVVGSDGNLMVEDTTLNISWADVASATNLTWSAAAAPGSAQAWIATLNDENYGGVNDWTLATGDGTYTAGSAYCTSIYGPDSSTLGCGDSTSATANQLGYLMFNELGNVGGSGTFNGGPFKNAVWFSTMGGSSSWSSTAVPNSNLAWFIAPFNAPGYEMALNGSNAQAGALAVRAGLAVNPLAAQVAALTAQVAALTSEVNGLIAERNALEAENASRIYQNSLLTHELKNDLLRIDTLYQEIDALEKK